MNEIPLLFRNTLDLKKNTDPERQHLCQHQGLLPPVHNPQSVQKERRVQSLEHVPNTCECAGTAITIESAEIKDTCTMTEISFTDLDILKIRFT